MKHQKVIFSQSQYDEQGDYAGKKEFGGVILDKYRDMSDGIREYPCDYYLVELDNGTIVSVRPHEIIKRIKEPLPFEVG